MNELNKLIQQYETENPDKKAAYRFQNMNHWGGDFVLWLASRPTCGVEQRKFLDEVEKLKYEVVLGCDGLAKELGDDQPIIYGSDFSANLSKVIKGE